MNTAPSAPLRIVVLCNRYLDRTGGAEEVAHIGVDGLRARGHSVSVVCLPETGSTAGFVRGRLSSAGLHRLTPHNLYHPRDAGRWPWPMRALWHLRDLDARRNADHVVDILRQERADLLLSHNLKGLGLRTAEAGRRTGVVHVHVLHDLQLCVPSGVLVQGREQAGDAAPRLRAWHARRARARFGSPALVVAPSQYLRDEHLRAGFFPDSRTEILPLPRHDPPAHAPPVGLPKVVFAGQLAAHKGLRVLLAAWRLRTSAAELHVAGDGDLRHEVAAAAAHDDSIHALGHLPRDRLHALYAGADVVAVPSLCYEGGGLVACEAQAHGAFVIASALGGLPEYVQEGGGELVPAGDVQALARALAAASAQVVGLRARRGQIAARAPGLAVASYCQRLEGLLAGLVERG